MCRHVTDTCYVSGTMPIRFLVKFYPILTPHTCLYLKGIRSYKITCKSRVDTWRTHVTCLGPSPLNSQWNVTPFWLLTLVCSSKGSEVRKSSVNHVSTRDGHVSHDWDHAHWIPGEILPYFDVRHVLVAHLEPKLEICKNIEQCVHCTVYTPTFLF